MIKFFEAIGGAIGFVIGLVMGLFYLAGTGLLIAYGWVSQLRFVSVHTIRDLTDKEFSLKETIVWQGQYIRGYAEQIHEQFAEINDLRKQVLKLQKDVSWSEHRLDATEWHLDEVYEDFRNLHSSNEKLFQEYCQLNDKLDNSLTAEYLVKRIAVMEHSANSEYLDVQYHVRELHGGAACLVVVEDIPSDIYWLCEEHTTPGSVGSFRFEKTEVPASIAKMFMEPDVCIGAGSKAGYPLNRYPHAVDELLREFGFEHNLIAAA